MKTSNPCQIEVSLTGPRNADFDLYVTLDGRTPTPDDFDKRSATSSPNEQVITDEIDADTELGILVDSASGSGSFEVSVEEVSF